MVKTTISCGHSGAPLGASWRPQTPCRLVPRTITRRPRSRQSARNPPQKAAHASLRSCEQTTHDIADAKAPAASDLRNIANDTTHAHAVSGERIWGRAANGQKSGARSCAKMVVAATAAGAATQSHPASTLPNRTQGQGARPKNNKTPHLPQRRSRACDPILTRRKSAPRSRSPAQQHRGTQWSFGTLFEGLRGGGRRICTRN